MIPKVWDKYYKDIPIHSFHFNILAGFETPKYDEVPAKQAYSNAIAGACLALEIKNAGTADPQVNKLIHDKIRFSLHALFIVRMQFFLTEKLFVEKM